MLDAFGLAIPEILQRDDRMPQRLIGRGSQPAGVGVQRRIRSLQA